MTIEQVEAEIARLVKLRQDIWGGRAEGAPGEAKRIASKLADLYDERRAMEARDRTLTRADVIRRARVESELERLMTR